MRRILLLVFAALAANNMLYGQGQFTTQGTDFWLTYGANTVYASNRPTLQLRIVAAENTQVTLRYTADTSLNTVVNVNAGQVYTRTLSESEKLALYNKESGTSNKSLHVTSNKNIALFAINLAEYTTDATNVLPASNLGTDYYHLSYTSIPGPGPGDGFCIVATEDATLVTDAGTSVLINAGQVYCKYFGYNSDITGRHITANKPVAYFTTNSCVQVPAGIPACDCLFQQLVPVPSWGNRFLVPATSRSKDRVRIVASQDSTVVNQTGGTLISGSLELNAGESVELEISQSNSGCYIVASRPVAVGAFLMGLDCFSDDNATGDPAFTWVPPVEQAVAHTIMAPFVAVGTSVLKTHYALIVTPTSTRNTTTVSISGGTYEALSGGSWTANAESGYSYYSMPLLNRAESTYEFQNSSGITIMGYGLGNYESYYYMAAASARQLDPAFYVSNMHFQDINGQNICDADHEFRASIQYSLGSGQGKLTWYIDGTERTTVQDMNTWTMPKGLLLGTHTVTLSIRDSYNQVKDVVSTFTVLAAPDTIPSGNVSATTICSGDTPAIRVSGTDSALDYRVFNASTGGDQVGTMAGNGGTINIPCTASLDAGTTYYVESCNGTCSSTPRTPVTVNVVERPRVTHLQGNTVCSGSTPVIRMGISVPGVIYNVYDAPSDGTIVGTSVGTGLAIDIILTAASASSAIYYVEAASGNCLSEYRVPVNVRIIPRPVLTLSNISTTMVSCYGESTGCISLDHIRLADYSMDDGRSWQLINIFSELPAGTYQIRLKTFDGCISDALPVTVYQPEELSAAFSITNALCHDGNGTVTVSASGGNAPYRYRLNSGSYQSDSTLVAAAGTHSVTVIDGNSCEKTFAGIVVSQPAAALAATASVSDLTCYSGPIDDGKITVIASGGTPPYQYSIDGGSAYQADGTFAGLAIGAYGVVVKDAGGCVTAMKTVHVSQAPVLNITQPIVVNVSCNGGNDGAITMSGIFGATPPYRYSFDCGTTFDTVNTRSGLSAGIYGINIMDSHDCISPNVPVKISEPDALLTPADVSADIVCPNLPATLTISNTLTGACYEIYDAATDGNLKASIAGNGTDQNVNMGIIPETTEFHIQTTSGSCTDASRVPVTVQVRKTTINYPDIRIEVCPNSRNINLSKYIDTLDLASLNWTSHVAPAIDATTGIIASVPSAQSVYTFKYNASSHCSTPVSRKVYLHVAANKQIFVPRDTIAVCWKYAEALQINQLFGIEAAGTWSTVPVLSPAYIRLSPSSSPYAGALTFNGKAAYEDGVLTPLTYRGEPARQIEFYYTVPAGECLGNRVYKVVTVLMPDITK
jgi:hypothetical protein